MAGGGDITGKGDGIVPLDPFAALRRATSARVGLGRSGDAMPLASVLAFQEAHALARDAVHLPLDLDALETELAAYGPIRVASQAGGRATYLKRPDLGRRLDEAARTRLQQAGEGFDIAFLIADGLSATAVAHHGASVFEAGVARLEGFTIAPPVLATHARVALGDDVGEALGARLVVVLIGERPGLSVAESLGAYLTYGPRRGRRDHERNCISNIHRLGGLSPQVAADKIAWLAREALRRKLTGVGLKDEAPAAIAAEPETPALRGT